MQGLALNVNGEIFTHPSNDAPRIRALDRGYLYGDSLYEVARTYGGRIFGLDEHLDRLEKSAALMRMKLTVSRAEFALQISRTHDAFRRTRSDEAYIRLIVSRGAGRIGFGHETIETPTLYSVVVMPLTPPSATQLAHGLHLQVAERLRNDRRALDPAAKTGNYLNSLLAYLEARPDGIDLAELPDDALLLDSDGFLTEGTTFNIFYVKRRIVVTPPLDSGILEGITRKHILRMARELGLETREVRFPPSRLFEADEVFLTSTIKEAFPITRLSMAGRPAQAVGAASHRGKPGPITLQLRERFHTWAKKEAAR